nr:hypothetical protein [Tanacetum cinerariifolium]
MKAKKLEFETKVAEWPGKGLPYYHNEEEAARSGYNNKPHNVVDVLDNDIDDIVKDVGEDELKNVIENLKGGNEYKNVVDNQNVDDENENKNVDNVEWQQPFDMSNNFEIFLK